MARPEVRGDGRVRGDRVGKARGPRLEDIKYHKVMDESEVTGLTLPVCLAMCGPNCFVNPVQLDDVKVEQANFSTFRGRGR